MKSHEKLREIAKGHGLPRRAPRTGGRSMIRSLRFARGQWGALHATRHGTRALCGRHVVEIPAGTIVAASEPTCAKCRGMARAAAGHVAIGILTDQLNDESVEPEVRAALARLVSSAERWWGKP